MVPGDGFEPPTRGFSIRAKSEENQEGRVSKRPRTDREPNENVSTADLNPAKENPGALAGATGTDLGSFWAWFDNNINRTIAATRLVDAVMNCAPEDRTIFLEIMIDELCPGWAGAFMVHAMTEARWLMAELSPSQRKAITLAGYESLSEAEKRSFVAHITGARHV